MPAHMAQGCQGVGGRQAIEATPMMVAKIK